MRPPPLPAQGRRDRLVAMLAADAGRDPGGGRADDERSRRHEADDDRARARPRRRLPGFLHDLRHPTARSPRWRARVSPTSNAATVLHAVLTKVTLWQPNRGKKECGHRSLS